jgi:uncharacterized membrane protein
MREVKRFFTQDNSLNKGYVAHVASRDEDENSMLHRKIAQNLPSADLITAYEEMHPGTFDKLLGFVEKEQLHRQKAEFASTEMHARATSMGRLFGFFVVCAICFTTLQLAREGMLKGGLIFAGLAFAGIFGISALSYFRTGGRSYGDRNRNNRPNQKTDSRNPRPTQSKTESPEDSSAQDYKPRRDNNNRRRRR